MDKKRYNSAFILLRKSLAKDSANVAAEFVLSRYYILPQNADFQLDSAYRYVNRALRHWKLLPDRSRKMLSKFPVDSVALIEQRQEVEAKAFEMARGLNNEEAYDRFIGTFVHAREVPLARQLQEKVAFEKAGAMNTHTAFLDYITRYPNSEFRSQAQKKYDRLLFEFSTDDNTVEAYTSYLNQHPQTPYRREVEKNIFEISTADGSLEAFERFLTTYPKSFFADQARSMLHHLHLEDSIAAEDGSAVDTSSSVRPFLIPFLQGTKFGFMSQHGEVIIPAEYDELDEGYLCGNIREDVIVLKGQVLTSEGKLLFEGGVSSLDDLGHGFLLAGLNEGGFRILHKAGYVVPEKNIDDAKLLNGKMLALKKGALWGLFTLTGRKLLDYECQDITAIGDVFIIKVNDKFTLSTLSSLAAIANAEKGKFTEAFDEVRKSFDDNIWIRLNKFEGVLDPRLQILVKVDTHQVAPTWFGAVATSKAGITTFNRFGEESPLFEDVQIINPWVAVKRQTGWELFDPVQRIAKSIAYDSIAVQGPFAVGFMKEGVEIHIHKRIDPLILPIPEQIEPIAGQDSLAYLMVKLDKKVNVFDQRGTRLFTTTYEKIQAAGKGIFIVSKKEKKGLVNEQGKHILPPEYDAIGNQVNDNISLLKGMKFGMYNIPRKSVIKPEYDKNIVPYGSRFYTVFKNGSAGFVDRNGKPVGKMEYAEIIPWTDSIALVRKDNSWQMLDLYSKTPVMEGISAFEFIRNTHGDRLMILKKDDLMGVLSSRHGMVIPVNFSDIINVGSAETPVYFTEKHVPEASLFVVIYYDHQGKFLRREVYEQDAYDKIYCHD
jgi:hypothetical protein